MAQAIFGRSGEVAGWLDGDDIRDLSGQARAFVHNRNLVDYRGRGIVGAFEDGVLRDTDGAAVGVLAGATGIVRPTLPAPPAPPPFGDAPPRPPMPAHPRRAPHRLEWSRLSLEELLE